MNNKLIFFIFIFLISPINAMKNDHRTITSNINNHHNLINFFDSIPNEIIPIIMHFCIQTSVAKKPKDAANTIKNLACTNQRFNHIANESEVNKDLINTLAYKFCCSHETSAKFLTKKSREILVLQQKLRNICYCPHTNALKILNELISKKINLDFTYNHPARPKTPLMIICSSCRCRCYNTFSALINHGANINAITPHGLTALHLVFEMPLSIPFYQHVITHPNLMINQQNKRGESALMYNLLKRRSHHEITIPFCKALKELLKAGADPKLATKAGITPLHIVKNVNDPILNEVFCHIIQEEQAQK